MMMIMKMMIVQREKIEWRKNMAAQQFACDKRENDFEMIVSLIFQRSLVQG